MTVRARLDELIELRTRIDHEIRAERIRVLGDGGRLDHVVEIVRPPGGTRVHTAESVQGRLEDAGITGSQVNEWALSVGLITCKKRGRPSRVLVDAYFNAREQEATAS